MSDLALRTGDVGRLKDLLFGEERRLLTEVQQIVSRHDERIGTDDRLQQSVSQIIALALRDAQVKQHEELAAAISPLVMAGVKREILNSRGDLIDAMHPMMGSMMSAYVTNGLRDFLHQTDRRLESGLSPRRWRLRIKSALTGVPVHELVLRERNLVKVVDILLLKRGSGVLVDRWQAEPDTEAARGQNPALLSGMLSAVTNFAREAFSDGKSELRTLDIGSARIFLRSSPAYLVAVRCVGQTSVVAERKIDRAVLRAFQDNSDVLSADARDGSAVRRVLPALADRLAEALAPDMSDSAVRSGRLRYVMALGALIGLMGFATVGRHIVKSMEVSAKQRELETVVAATEAFRGLPIAVRQDQNGRGFVVSGVAPSQDAAVALNQALQEAAGAVPVAVNLVTGLVTSTNAFVGETLNVVTGVVDGTVRGVVNTVDNTTRTAVNLAGDVTKTAVKTADGVVRATVDVVTQTAGAVETLTKRLGNLEQSLALAAPDGKVVQLPKPIADLPQKLAETEDRIKRGVAERSLSDLTGRLQTLKQQLKSSNIAANDVETERLEREVTALQNGIDAARSRLKSKSGADIGSSEDMNALSMKVANVERDTAVAPFKRQVQTLSDGLRDLTARVVGGDAPRGGEQDEPQSRKARRKDVGDPGKDNFDLAGELNKSLNAGPIDAEPYSAEDSVRELASRVRGTALGPKVNGRPMSGATSAPLGNDRPGNPIQGAIANTQNVVTGVTNTKGNAVTGVANTTRNIVGGVTNATGAIVKGLSGRK